MVMVAQIAVVIVAVLHAAIGGVEMFLWKRPRVHGRLAFTQAEASKVAPIVANAGLYNMFVAAGLAWSVYTQDPRFSVFFLVFVAIAGLYGAATLKKTTLFLQTIPAVVAALFVLRA